MDKVLLIDDESSIHVAVRKLLTQSGYEYCGAQDGETGLFMLEQEKPDLVLLDVMLPGMNGFDICDSIRQSGSKVPIIFLSAKSDIVDKSIGFKVGGDDYVAKPFNSQELILRIEALIRRHKDSLQYAPVVQPSKTIVVGDLELHADEYQVFVKGRPVSLTAKEFEILALLASNPRKVFTRSQIQEHIWGEDDVAVQSNSITVLVRKIREKIEENPGEPRYLITVRRVGYKVEDSTSEQGC